MKKIKVLLAVCMIMLMCSACQENNKSGEINSNNGAVSTVSFDMPAPFGELSEQSGGDMATYYYQPCIEKLDSIPVDLLRLVPEDDINKWVESFGVFPEAPTSILDYVNIFSFIQEFNISNDVFIEKMNELNDSYTAAKVPDMIYTDDELSLICLRNESEIMSHFKSDYSIVMDGKIYSPQWIYTHSMKDYTKEGLSAELVNEKVDNFIDDIPFTKEAKKALETKVDAYSKVLEQEKIADNNSEK